MPPLPKNDKRVEKWHEFLLLPFKMTNNCLKLNIDPKLGGVWFRLQVPVEQLMAVLFGNVFHQDDDE